MGAGNSSTVYAYVRNKIKADWRTRYFYACLPHATGTPLSPSPPICGPPDQRCGKRGLSASA